MADGAVADKWGQLLARAENTGRTVAAADALIAATADVHSLKIVTRNAGHFRDAGVEVVSPWLK
jgi:toxin FitB